MKPLTSSEFVESYDRAVELLICSVSFEDRCLNIPALVKESKRLKRAVIFVTSDVLGTSQGRRNLKLIRNYYSGKSYIIKYDRNAPIKLADHVVKIISTYRRIKIKNILIDTTTFTHESLLILYRILRENQIRGERHQYAYIGAKEYSLGDEKENKWLSKGVKEIRSVLGFAGSMKSNKTHLIILVGFERERASTLITTYEPSIVSLGYGAKDESIEASHYDANQHFLALIKQMSAIYDNVNDFDFSCEDPERASTKILEQASKYPTYNTILSPMNTKMSTLGAGMAATIDKTIQIVYAPALIYNYNNYSSPGNRFYLFTG